MHNSRKTTLPMCSLLLVALALVFSCESALAAEFPPTRVFGRFHPLLVHFPISLLLVALGIELWMLLRKREPSPTAGTCLMLGSIAAIIAALAGWFNAAHEEPGNDSDLLAAHRWLGVATAAGAVVATALSFAAHRNRTTTLIGSYRASLMVVAVLVGLTGHFGGVITHGSAYLGQPIAAVFGMREAKRPPAAAPQTPAPDRTAATPPSADSAVPIPGAAPPSEVGPIDFATHVKPILEASCISCHGAAKRRGGLRLDTREDAMKGGKHGPCILPGNSRESDLIIRVRGEGDEQPMPLDLPPLSEEQIRILADWIDQGAPWPDEHAAAKGSDVHEEIHWAYIAPRRPDIPRVVDSGRVREWVGVEKAHQTRWKDCEQTLRKKDRLFSGVCVHIGSFMCYVSIFLAMTMDFFTFYSLFPCTSENLMYVPLEPYTGLVRFFGRTDG